MNSIGDLFSVRGTHYLPLTIILCYSYEVLQSIENTFTFKYRSGMMESKRKKRIGMTVFGVCVAGISVGFFKRSIFGVDPFQSFMNGLDAMLPIGFGSLYVIANICLLFFSLIFDRSKIGLGTIINLLFTGYIADYSHQILLTLFPSLGLAGRIIMLLIGITAMCYASAFYFTANLGVSTYDAIALIISEKWGHFPFKFVRILCDLTCVILGITLYLGSGKSVSNLKEIVGIGTIITAFFMGPLIDYFNIHVAAPFLEK